MIRGNHKRWLSGVGVAVFIGGLALVNYGGGVAPAAAHSAHQEHQNPFKQILSKLNEILDLPPINQVGAGVRIPADGRRGHGTETLYRRRDHWASADHRD